MYRKYPYMALEKGQFMFDDFMIIDSWAENATSWIKAIQNKEIESRNLSTNQAIIDAIIKISPQTVLDVGCGEGWLAKELVKKDMFAMGIDAIPSLIEHARENSHATFDICTYENLPHYQFNKKFDCIVCNFSLIGKESTEIVIKTASKILNPDGHLIVQTLHPVAASLDKLYQDGWREGSWAGFNTDFKNPAPWYFRTISSWYHLFKTSGFHIVNLYEPIHPVTKKPLSIIFDGCKHYITPQC